jgi:sporulation protein YlmC with PRC-barrel domain
MKLAHAAVLALVITITNPVSAEIDASQADARLIGMPIYTYDGVLIGQVAGVEVTSTRRSLVADTAIPMGFGFARVRIPLSWVNKEEDYILLLMTSEQITPFLGPGRGIGSR